MPSNPKSYPWIEILLMILCVGLVVWLERMLQ